MHGNSNIKNILYTCDALKMKYKNIYYRLVMHGNSNIKKNIL